MASWAASMPALRAGVIGTTAPSDVMYSVQRAMMRSGAPFIQTVRSAVSVAASAEAQCDARGVEAACRRVAKCDENWRVVSSEADVADARKDADDEHAAAEPAPIG